MPAQFEEPVQPAEIGCEITPTTSFEEFTQQDSRTTLRTPGSEYPVKPPAEICPSVPEYRQRARVTATFFGVLPDGLQQTMTGAIDRPSAHAFAKANYQNVMEDVFDERFSPRLFIEKFLRGTFSTSKLLLPLEKMGN